jgi:endoglucanase
MNNELLLEIAGRLMRHPAVACHEHAVREEVEAICREHSLAHRRDLSGNVLVSLRTAPRLRPVVLSAHMDHPGFEIQRSAGPHGWQARFRGGVPEDYFVPGTLVRLMPGNAIARLGRRLDKAKKTYLLKSATTGTPPKFAVWDLPAFAIRRGRIHGRACDDLIGVASILAVMVELKRKRAAVNVIGAITRAEEVGFLGALALAARRTLPRNALVISLETSRELPGSAMGQGVILRTGDKASIFNSDATRYLAEVAVEVQKRDRTFHFQRALMSGGTCEATAYQEYGYQSSAVCVALGNYHNCGGDNRIEAEYVSVHDASSMVQLLVVAARRMQDYTGLVARLPQRLRALLAEARTALIG